MINILGKIIANIMLLIVPVSIILMIWVSFKVWLTVLVVDVTLILVISLATVGSENSIEQ